MFSRSKQTVTNEQLDRIGQALVRAAADNDDAAETAATAPFLYTRLRARITEDGTLRRFVNVFVADDDVRFLEGLDTKVPDGETVSIVPAVAGGI